MRAGTEIGQRSRAPGPIEAPIGDVRSRVGVIQTGHVAVLPSIQLPTSGLTRALAAGLEVYPWVVDDLGLLDELADLGVSGIISDDPAAARSALERQR